MIENESKGWYGSLSKIGRDAAILAFLKLSGFKGNVSKKHAKKKVPKMDSDNLDHFKDNLIIIQAYHNSVKNINKSNKKMIIKNSNKNKEEKIESHNYYHPQTEIEELRYINSPSCTKYTPKYNLVYPKLITGPKWKIISGRKDKKLEIDEKDFLITHESKIDSGYKYLVNMNKTTKRGDIFGNKDVRVRTDKRFDVVLSSKNKKNKNKDKKNKNKDKTIIKNKTKFNEENSVNELKKNKTLFSSLKKKKEEKKDNEIEKSPKINNNTLILKKLYQEIKLIK